MRLQVGIGFERQLSKQLTISANYLHTSGVHALRSRNINAPLPGTGLRPYGGDNSIYLYETSPSTEPIDHQPQRWASSKLTISGFYALGSVSSNTDGAASFPSNQYDLSTEYGRAGYDTRHRLQLHGSFATRWDCDSSPSLLRLRPFNLVADQDLNGDGLFTDRPALATDLTRPSVVHTAYGVFDRSPLPGQVIIPRNYGHGPSLLAANVRVSKMFTFGEHAGAGKQSGDPRQLILSVNARNFLNHPNLGAPDGNLSHPCSGSPRRWLPALGRRGIAAWICRFGLIF